jgi:hypothetical protein
MWVQLRTQDETQAALIEVYLACSPRLAELLKVKETFDEVTPRDEEILEIINICLEHVNTPLVDIHKLREDALASDPIAKAKTEDLVQVIAGDRLVVRRLFVMAIETKNPRKLAHYVQEYSLAAPAWPRCWRKPRARRASWKPGSTELWMGSPARCTRSGPKRPTSSRRG